MVQRIKTLRGEPKWVKDVIEKLKLDTDVSKTVDGLQIKICIKIFYIVKMFKYCIYYYSLDSTVLIKYKFEPILGVFLATKLKHGTYQLKNGLHCTLRADNNSSKLTIHRTSSR